jgi:hypothetical protein
MPAKEKKETTELYYNKEKLLAAIKELPEEERREMQEEIQKMCLGECPELDEWTERMILSHPVEHLEKIFRAADSCRRSRIRTLVEESGRVPPAWMR